MLKRLETKGFVVREQSERGFVYAPSVSDKTARKSALSQVVRRSEEHTSELQSLMRISYAVFRLNKKPNSRRSEDSFCMSAHLDNHSVTMQATRTCTVLTCVNQTSTH